MSEFENYERLKIAGVEPQGAYLKAKDKGMNAIEATRMLREVYGLDLMSAKAEMVRVDSKGIALSEYQESLIPALKEAFSDD